MPEQAATSAELFVVDDDVQIRELLSMLFEQAGYQVTGFAEGNSFLAAARAHTPACILLDVHMPGPSGIDVLKLLDAQHYGAPILVISAQGEIPLAVDAIKHGAFDFIVKPFDLDSVLERVRGSIAVWRGTAEQAGSPDRLDKRFPGHEHLTPREREVLAQITGGASNKEAGLRLAISPRTVEVHRARIMEKVGAKNAADLVRIVLSQNGA